MTTKKRFIAGAICPECGAEDRLVVEETLEQKRRRCVSCGFSDANASEPEVSLPTRFARRGTDTERARPVRLLDDGSADS
jgi:uncharacterized metal-binding protein (TIGR02443 family)